VPEILEGVAAVWREDAGEIDALFLREAADEAGRRGALEVEVQLDLGQVSHALMPRWPSR
jgi:hypothetical protein